MPNITVSTCIMYLVGRKHYFVYVVMLTVEYRMKRILNILKEKKCKRFKDGSN